MASSNQLDVSVCEAMANLVEKLTTTGKPVLDQQQMKAFKKICKQSDEYVKHAYHLLITQLEKPHSEIRISCFLMFDELFQRSHCFREQLLADFQYFLILVAETDVDTPLPPPKPAAKALKMKSLETIQTWHEKFSSTYKKLSLGYNFLQHCKKVDFNDIRARNVAERRKEEQQRLKKEQQRKEKLEIVTKELNDGRLEIENVITQLENCIQLLLPDLDTFNLHGLASPEYRPNYNPFRIPSRRKSSIEASTSKSPVYGPCMFTGDNTKEAAKLPSPGSSKGGKRKSSSGTSDTSVASPHQQISKTNVSSNQSQPSSPTRISCPRHTASEFTIKQEPMEDNDDIFYRTQGEASSGQNSVHMKQEIGSGKYSRRDRRKSSVKEAAENEDIKERIDTSQKVNAPEVQVECERTRSVEDSDLDDNIEEMSDEEEEYFQHSQFVRESGLCSQNYTININLHPDNEVHITETADNSDILGNLKDLNRELVNKWLPAVVKWLEVLTKNGADKEFILKAIDLKRHIMKVKEKISKIKVTKGAAQTLVKPSVSMESKEDSDSDFEEVPEKEGYEPHIPDELRHEYGLVNKQPKPSTSKDWKLEDTTAEYNDVSDPSSWQATVKKIEEKIIEENQAIPSTSELKSEPGTSDSPKPKRKGKDPNIPSVPFGTDLLHWGEENVALPLLVRYESDLKGWVPTREDEDRVDVNALESRRSRVINFEGEFIPVKWKCRAPLPSGKLCERMDRQKCPFHGKVIARDNDGNPTDPADIARLAEQEFLRTNGKDSGVDWEDTELQADIQAQTGVQLVREKKGKGKGRQKKYPGLTDLKKTSDSCRTRLQTKVLSKNALKRVAASMDKIRDKKIKDKFGNNFAYAVPRR